MKPRKKPMLDRLYYDWPDGKRDSVLEYLKMNLRLYDRYKDSGTTPELRALDLAFTQFNTYFDAGQLPGVTIYPQKDNAVYKAQYMFPDELIRNGFYNSLIPTVDPRTSINRLWDLYVKSGKPSIKAITPANSIGIRFLQKVGLADGSSDRPYYNPILNTIYIDPKQAAHDVVSELSHAYLFYGTDTPRDFNWIKLYFSLPGDIKIDGKRGYSRPGNIEYNAHKIIEPRFHLYINGGRHPYDFIWNGILKAYNKPIKPKRGPYMDIDY